MSGVLGYRTGPQHSPLQFWKIFGFRMDKVVHKYGLVFRALFRQFFRLDVKNTRRPGSSSPERHVDSGSVG